MSLENKIEMLTKSIDALNANITLLVSVPIVDDPKLAAEILDREMPKAGQLTHKEVQDQLLIIVRKNTSLKPKIKALLAGLSASKVSDIALDRLGEFKSAIENL